jgi:hypothetical protein
MHNVRRPLGRAAVFCALFLAALGITYHVRAAETAKFQVDDYQIDAHLTPKTNRLAARAQVKITALDDVNIATFELHNGLRVSKVWDEEHNTLPSERILQENAVRVQLQKPLTKGSSTTLTFDYEGALQSADDSPVQGLKLAYVGEPISYLLYAGRWFPVTGYGTDRFTATMHITVPNDITVIGSGGESAPAAPAATPATQAAPPTQAPATPAQPQATPQKPQASVSGLPLVNAFQTAGTSATAAPKKTTRRAPRKTKAAPEAKAPAKASEPEPFKKAGPNEKTYTFVWNRASFPGTIIAGRFTDTAVSEAGLNIHVYFLPDKKQFAAEYGATAAREFAFFTTLYGPTGSTNLKLVQLPDDTVPSTWAPEIAAVAARAISEKTNYRLVANAVAHQWWGSLLSPTTRNDTWITEGLARYSEARYIDHVAGQAAFEDATKDMSVGALACETTPLSQVGQFDSFDPTFQSLVTDKGGMIFHMLRWVIGDANFDKAMRSLVTEYAGKPIAADDLRKVTEQASGQQLTWFYTQWLDSTGAPEFKDKYTVFRTPKGFRIVGQIQQDLDLFRMPVELKVDTDGQTEMKRIDVVGTDSSFVVETFGKPRRITVDPDNRVLKNSPDLKVRTAIVRGQQLVQQGNLAEALKEFQKALESNKNSSLAHYRIAEVFYLQRNYQAAANAYRDALNGDADPRWTEVWSHIQLGKIFDLTGQRERALNEYKQAIATNDNTQGALEEARKYTQKPYQPVNTSTTAQNQQ